MIEYLVKNLQNKESKSETMKFWQDNLRHEPYIDYYNDLTSKELDQEFRKDIKSIAKILGELSESKKIAFINFLSNYIEFYIDQKLEKEIDSSLNKILKIL